MKTSHEHSNASNDCQNSFIHNRFLSTGAQLMAITVPLGILLLVVAATIGLTCCCCPAVIPPCCCCKRKSLPQSEAAATECDDESGTSLANNSPVYNQVADATFVTDDRRRSSSLPAPPPPHSRQFQSGVVYGQVSTDKGLEPRAAQKISNASVFRPYRDWRRYQSSRDTTLFHQI